MVFKNHVIPRETVAWLGLCFWCVPILLLWCCVFLSPPSLSPRFRRPTVLCLTSRWKEDSILLLLSFQLVMLGFPRLAMKMSSSSSAAPCLTLPGSPIWCVVRCLDDPLLSSHSSVMRAAPCWSSCSCSSCHLRFHLVLVLALGILSLWA